MRKRIADPARAFRHKKAKERLPRRVKPGSGAKKPVNLSVDASVLADAKAMGLNLSQVLEEALRHLVQDERNRRFQEENREAIESYNEFIAKHGIWSEKYRTW